MSGLLYLVMKEQRFFRVTTKIILLKKLLYLLKMYLLEIKIELVFPSAFYFSFTRAKTIQSSVASVKNLNETAAFESIFIVC